MTLRHRAAFTAVRVITIATSEPLLRPLNVRIRDVQQSRDGFLYVATELRFGGSDANGTVLRLEPVEGS
jgi:glucose/arabinose dehydrogenase